MLNASSDEIYGDVRCAGNDSGKPAVIICHSFMAFKDWGFFPYLAEELARAGFLSVSFNFSYNGVAGHGNRITDFEKFERNTFSRELEDLDTVVRAVRGGKLGFDKYDSESIVLLGHSRGGGIAAVYASSNSAVKELVTWSAISTFDRWTHHQKEKWIQLRYLPLAKDTAVSPLRQGIGLLHDLQDHSERLNILDAASRINIPWLILHGEADVTVPPREAEHLYEVSRKNNVELKLLGKVGHLYSAASQQENNYQTLNEIIHITTSWIHRHLEKE